MEQHFGEVLTFVEAQRRLGVTDGFFNALVKSWLLGRITTDNRLFVEGIQSYERYGTQWVTEDRPELPQRTMTTEYLRSIPPPPDVGHERYPSVQQKVFAAHDGIDDDILTVMESSTGWLAHFYLRPNVFCWPAPTSMGMVEGPLLKLPRKREVLGADLRTVLYPDPWGSLALVAVHSPRPTARDAFEVAYDVAGPILDELSVRYDQPLPISHSFVVYIPSALMATFFPSTPDVKTLEQSDRLLPRYPYSELKFALALYREGVSSSDPFHQFLALWKVYENAREVRRRWRTKHKRQVVRVKDERLPRAFAFREYEGKTFDEVRQELNGPLRVAVAHGGNLRGGGEPKTAASAEDLLSVSYAVPVVRYIAQITLQNVRATLESPSSSNNTTR